MKKLMPLLLLFSCATFTSSLSETDEKALKEEIAQMESALNNLTYAVHRPIYKSDEE